LDDGFLLGRGLTNFWGYNTIGFFAPHSEYAAAHGGQAMVEEFKTMVRKFHRAGIEVILDVVYNHTAEGDENGPMIFLRGLDNAGYYMLNADVRVVNYTGTGNTLNAASPPALRLVMDSLRYWVEVMHVDGFRFDLAATLGRRGDQFDYFAPFFQAVAQDPVLRNVKLIAEPWDIGPNGYQVGGFPKPWRELNGRYRDRVRRFWRGDSGAAASFAKRLCGSQEIFSPSGRSPLSSVNFVISHDGFTLRDLWTYNEKHNEANGEENRDGDNNNHGWNGGVEGETDDEEINATRRKLARACLATMFCSLGVPFLCAGDERWRTQAGNNNAYCQDNEVSWLDWAKDDVTERMADFVADLIRFRLETPVLRRATHFNGRPDPLTGKQDVAWLDMDGTPLSHERWHDPQRRAFSAILDGTLLLLFNTSDEKVEFLLPPGKWLPVFDTAQEPSFGLGGNCSESVMCASRSLLCLKKPPEDNETNSLLATTAWA
jgi:glycogen operon protein